jgi:hypothetical protein
VGDSADKAEGTDTCDRHERVHDTKQHALTAITRNEARRSTELTFLLQCVRKVAVHLSYGT